MANSGTRVLHVLQEYHTLGLTPITTPVTLTPTSSHTGSHIQSLHPTAGRGEQQPMLPRLVIVNASGTSSLKSSLVQLLAGAIGHNSITL